MSSLRNAVPRPAHKERHQPSSRKTFGLLEKHKDYVERANAFHKKQDTLRILREKAANRNEDEFYFKMVNTKTVNGVHRPMDEDNKYTQQELILMKTQDIGYVLPKLQSERKKVEKLSAMLHSIDNKPLNSHVYFADDREEAKELKLQLSKRKTSPTSEDIPSNITRKTERSYKELEARKIRVSQLEKVYMDMAMKKELQKNGRKRKLREDEIVNPTNRPVYKWFAERKR
ncbi:putative U3 small nucleolar RNA-associated protein [Trifolium repens]|nr:putative U3 small nucleolar RNA-associated protein [Trifolium repens]